MLLAVTCVGTRFSRLEYLGALVIFAGLAVDIGPSVVQGSSLSSGTKASWAVVFLAGQVPAAAGSIYQALSRRFCCKSLRLELVTLLSSTLQEIAFREAKCNVIYMMAWSSLAQAISVDS